MMSDQCKDADIAKNVTTIQTGALENIIALLRLQPVFFSDGMIGLRID